MSKSKKVSLKLKTGEVVDGDFRLQGEDGLVLSNATVYKTDGVTKITETFAGKVLGVSSDNVSYVIMDESFITG